MTEGKTKVYHEPDISETVRDHYLRLFGEPPELLIRTPGRINLLGEHTDYNQGLVLPAAIDKYIVIALGRNEGPQTSVYSVDFSAQDHFLTQQVAPGPVSWANYIRGVVKQLAEKEMPVGSFKAVFAGSIPVGSGLSSSAALECGFAYGLNELFEGNLSPMQLALAGQAAEHEFIGVKCGIMDQFASVFGKEGHLMELDCRSMGHRYHAIDLEEYELVLFNSLIHHELASSEYNIRREQCEAGVAALSEKNAGIRSLRDASLSDLEAVKETMKMTVYRRCKYVIEENSRVREMIEAVRANDLPTVGQIMYRTHEGLSKEYEVSCAELDTLIDLVKTEPTVLGARMMGGGFGGCTINLVKSELLSEVVDRVKQAYHRKFNVEMKVYQVSLAEGAKIISDD